MVAETDPFRSLVDLYDATVAAEQQQPQPQPQPQGITREAVAGKRGIPNAWPPVSDQSPVSQATDAVIADMGEPVVRALGYTERADRLREAADAPILEQSGTPEAKRRAAERSRAEADAEAVRELRDMGIPAVGMVNDEFLIEDGAGGHRRITNEELESLIEGLEPPPESPGALSYEGDPTADLADFSQPLTADLGEDLRGLVDRLNSGGEPGPQESFDPNAFALDAEISTDAVTSDPAAPTTSYMPGEEPVAPPAPGTPRANGTGPTVVPLDPSPSTQGLRGFDLRTQPRAGGGRAAGRSGTVTETTVRRGMTPGEVQAQAAAGEALERAGRNNLSLTLQNAGLRADEADAIANDESIGYEEMQEEFDRSQEEVARRLRDADEAISRMQDSSVSPSRLFSRGGASTLGAALSIAAGQMGAMLGGGSNTALQIIESAIERDIDAQVRESQNESRGFNNRLLLLDRVRSQMTDRRAQISTLRMMHRTSAIHRLQAQRERLLGKPAALAEFDTAIATLQARNTAERIERDRNETARTLRTTHTGLRRRQAAAMEPFERARANYQGALEVAEIIGRTDPERGREIARQATERLAAAGEAAYGSPRRSGSGGGSGRRGTGGTGGGIREPQTIMTGAGAVTLTPGQPQRDGTPTVNIVRHDSGEAATIPLDREHTRLLGRERWLHQDGADDDQWQSIADHRNAVRDFRHQVRQLRSQIASGQQMSPNRAGQDSRVAARIGAIITRIINIEGSVTRAGTIGTEEAHRFTSQLGPVNEDTVSEVARNAMEMIRGNSSPDRDRALSTMNALADLFDRRLADSAADNGFIFGVPRNAPQNTETPGSPERDPQSPGLAPAQGVR